MKYITKNIKKIDNNMYGIDLNDFNTSEGFSSSMIHFIQIYTNNSLKSIIKTCTHIHFFFNTPNYGFNIVYKINSFDFEIFENLYEDFKNEQEEDNLPFLYFTIQPTFDYSTLNKQNFPRLFPM